MDGSVRYNSLQEAVDALNNYAQQLDDPIDRFLQEANMIGEAGSEAWGGTAAESVKPVLDKIKADIVQLQAASAEFSENVNRSLQNYTEADARGAQAVQDAVNN